MRRIILFCLLVISFGTSWKAIARQLIRDSIQIQGYMRHFSLIIPENTPKDAPLVFVAHGYGNSGKTKTWMDKAEDKYKFALCVPIGLKDPGKNKHSWNVGYPSQQGWDVDDVKSMCKMALYVQKKYHLSKVNTFFTGMSNGGEMCYLLAYSGQRVFKAFASVSGLTMEWIYRTMDAPFPVPIFEIHGTADHTSEWDGDLENKGGWGAYMPTPIGIGYWVARNKCKTISQETVASLQPESNRTIEKYRYSGGPTGCDVWLYKVVNGPHSWFDKDLDTGEEIWQFFSKYVK